MIERRIQTAKNLLFKLVGTEWLKQTSRDIGKTFNDVYPMFDLFVIHNKVALWSQDQFQPGHKQLLSLSASVDELSDLYQMFERAIKNSDKRIPNHGSSIANLGTFISNTKKGKRFSYAPGEWVVRGTPPQ